MTMQGISTLPQIKGFFQPGQPGGETAQQSTASMSAADQAALRSWLEQAYTFQAAVNNGGELDRTYTTEELAQFEAYVSWAEEQLGLASSSWGDSIGMGGSSNGATGYQDPFGGYVHNGAIIYDMAEARVGVDLSSPYTTHHVYSNSLQLDISNNAAIVDVVKSMDDSYMPGEEVLKVVVRHPATGAEKVYILHGNLEDFDLKINHSDSSKVNDPEGIATVGRFEPGDLNPDLPSYAENLGNGVYRIDGIAGAVADIGPGFEGVDQVDVYSDINLQALNSDHLFIEKLPNGDTRITTTNKDGEKTIINVKEGYKANLSANASNVEFRVSNRIGSRLGKDVANGAAGVPSGARFANITLNGQGPIQEAQLAEGITPIYSEKVNDFLAALGLEGTELPEAILEELELGVIPPSTNLLNWIRDNSPTAGAAWTSYTDSLKSGSASPTLLAQFRDMLAGALGKIYDNVSATGDLPEGANEDAAIFFNGRAYNVHPSSMDAEGNFTVGLTESDFSSPVEENENTGLNDGEQAMKVAQSLASMGLKHPETGEPLSPQEIADLMAEKGYNLAEMPRPGRDNPNGFGPSFWEFVCSMDEDLTAAMEDLKSGKVADLGRQARAVTDRMIEYMQALFRDCTFLGTTVEYNFSGGAHGDQSSGEIMETLRFQNDIEMITPSGEKIVFNAFGDNYLMGYTQPDFWNLLGPFYSH